MIPELYDKQVINNKAVPIAYLTDIVLCEVTEERNGIFELYAEYPSTGNNAELIEREMLIKVKTNDSQNSQYFRIYRIFKSMNGFMQIYAQHISYDLADIVIKPKNFGTVNPENILTQILNNTDFSGFSTYDNAKKFKTTEPRSIRAILGGSEESILRKWHGEYTFDNFDITFTPARGEDKSGDSTYNIEYGKNLSDISFDGDNSGIYTKVMPFAYDENDKLVFLNAKEYPDGLIDVQLPIEGSELGREKILALDVSQLFEEDETVDSESVMQKAEAYITDNIIGVVIPSITVNIEPYTQDEVEYHICDTVKVVYPPFNIDCTAKITRIVYDSILERCKEITVGNIQQSFADSVVSIVDKATQKNKNTVEKVNAITEELKESVKEATDKITGVTGENGGYVHLIQNADGTTKEICITDTPDIKTAKKVWRWNKEGLGFSDEGYNGNYGGNVALTDDGKINASRILTGELTASVIKAGTITSADGHNYWNIESGKIKVDDAIIAGFHVAGNKNPDNGFYKYSLSTIINTEAGVISAEKPQFAVFLRGQSEDATAGARTPNMIVLGVKKRISSADAWSDNTKAPYTFTLAANGSITATSGNIAGWNLSEFAFSKSYKMTENNKSVDYSINIANPIVDNLVQPLIYCLRKPGTDVTKWEYKFKLNTDGSADFTDLNVSNINISGGQLSIGENFSVSSDGILTAEKAVISSSDGTAKVAFSSGGLTFHTTVNKVLKQYGLIKAAIDGNIDMTNPVLCIQANASNAAGMMLSAGTKAWYGMFKEGVQQTDDMDSVKHKFYGQTFVNGKLYSASTFYTSGNVVLDTSSSYLYVRNTSGTNRRVAGLSSNDNVIIGNADTKTIIYGTGVYLNGTSTAVTSDKRLKYDIEPLDDKREEFFKKLKPVNFKYIDGTSKRTHTGFIAQDVKAAGEECGIDTQDLAAYTEFESEREDFDTEAALRYEEFIALNTQMIQKLMARVDELEKEIKELKG